MRLPAGIRALVILGGLALLGSPCARAGPAPSRFTYGADSHFPPYDYLDASGQPQGFDVELVRLLARDAKVDVEIRLDGWDRILSGLESGNVDLVCLSRAHEREGSYAWLGQTWTLHQSVLFRADRRSPLRDLHELAGATIAVQFQSASESVLLHLPDVERPILLGAGTQAEALRQFAEGKADAVAGNSLTLRIEAARQGIRDVGELELEAVPYGFATLQGRQGDLQWIVTSMAHLRERGAIESLAERFLVVPEPSRSMKDYFWPLALGIAGILGFGSVGYAWSRSLQHQVQNRTRELQATLLQKDELSRAQKSSQERFSTFLGLTSEGIARFELDPVPIDAPEDAQVARILGTAHLADCNEAFLRMSGRSPGAPASGLPFSQFAPEGELADTMRTFVRRGHAVHERESPRTGSDGELVWLSVSLVGVRENGRLAAFWVSQRDITAAKQADADLRKRGRILEAVASSSAHFLEPGRWESHAPEALAPLALALGVPYAFVFENFHEKGEPFCRLLQGWAKPGFRSLSGGDDLRKIPFRSSEFGKWCENSLFLGQPVLSLVRDMPEAERRLVARTGILSALLVPIFVEGRWWGQFAFGELEYERQWSGAEIGAMQTAAQALGAAIARQGVESALRSSEKKYRDIFDLAPIGIYQARRDGRLITANARLAKMLGYDSVEEVLGLEMARDVYHDPDERERILERVRREGDPLEIEVLFKRKDKSPIWVQVAGHLTRDADNDASYSEGFVRDISGRKRAESERDQLYVQVKRAATEWHRTFDAVESALLLLDLQGRIVRLNLAASHLVGKDYAEALGKPLGELGAGPPWDQAIELVSSVRTTRAPGAQQARETGGRTWDLTAGFVRVDASSEGRIILVARDITRIIALQESLQRSETMSALGSLVAGVAHEVRNPLFSISATLDAFEAEFGIRDEYSDFVSLLRSQVARLNQLMRDLLDYGKPPVARLTPARLQDVIQRGIRATASLARDREVHVRVASEAPLPPLALDVGRIEQVFENLLANAIQHSPKDGTVCVTTSLVHDGDRRFVVGRIEDAGPGIPEADLPHLFEPFFSRRKGGTGLGLSIVQRIVDAHGGTVRVANREGGGAAFTVTLPVAGGEGEAEEAR
jgi:PAS domain S-box-containing protein